MADTQTADKSLHALTQFREQVERYGLWRGAWVGVAAIRKNGDWIPFLYKAHLTAPGVHVPRPDTLFDATTDLAFVRSREVSLDACWRIHQELACGDATSLSELIGLQLRCYEADQPSSWSFGSSTYTIRDRVHLLASRSIGAPFYKIFGFELYDRLGPHFRSHEPPYGSLCEIADAMMFWGGAGSDNHNANPLFEVTAQFPLEMRECFYNRAHRAIEIRLEVGATVPLSRVSASLTPEPRQRLSGDGFRAQLDVDGETRTLTALLPCDEPTREVTVHVQFDHVQIASSVIRPTTSERLLPSHQRLARSAEEWEGTLHREFHWTRRSLRRRLRTLLPLRVAEAAEWRIRESILLRDRHPFFAVLSAASVAEVLLQNRLARVSRKVRAARWSEIRAVNPQMPRKVPAPEDLKFDYAIRLAQALGLLGDLDLKSIDLLRMARNEIHLDKKSRPPAEDFSPARASHAVLTTLDVCRLLAEVTKARPAKHRATPQTPAA